MTAAFNLEPGCRIVAPVKRLASLPAAFLAYALGWWGISHGQGILGASLPFLWILSYYGVFWGGWLAIPLLGLGATFLQPFLPEAWRWPVKAAFVGWLLAWLGVLVALIWLGAPRGFGQVPL